jgi:hypothetical protein
MLCLQHRWILQRCKYSIVDFDQFIPLANEIKHKVLLTLNVQQCCTFQHACSKFWYVSDILSKWQPNEKNVTHIYWASGSFFRHATHLGKHLIIYNFKHIGFLGQTWYLLSIELSQCIVLTIVFKPTKVS